MVELEGIPPEALVELLEGSGRARQVWQSLLAGNDPYTDASLSNPLRARLRETTEPTRLEVERRDVAACGTIKLRLALGDGTRVETVVIPSERRTTVCVSTQAGCARGCIFCVTATMGLARGLTVSEIARQVVIAIRETRQAKLPPVRNVVYMGMGEPLDNLSAVADSIEVLCSPHGLALGPAHLTLSTVGTTPDAIRATKRLPVRIAWSVHAADDTLRRRLVPTTRHPMTELRDAFRELERRIFIEMILMQHVNDEPDHADALTDFLEPFAIAPRINLLPMNAGREGVAASSDERVIAFRQRLRARGYFCAIRRPRGSETNAACGQLAVS